MTMLWGRCASILLSDRLFARADPHLRITFRVERTDNTTRNKASIGVYNLKQETSAKASTAGAPVVLEAGYCDATTQLFCGTTLTAEQSHERTDRITKLECTDDGGTMQARINQSFAAGTRLADVIDAVVSAMGVGRGNVDEAVSSARFRKAISDYPRGIALFGLAVDCFDQVITTAGYTWSIQDGQLLVLEDEATSTVSAVKLSYTSGLISAGRAQGGRISCRALLCGTVRPRDRIVLDTTSISGTYRVERIIHQGDTGGSDWYSQIEGKPV